VSPEQWHIFDKPAMAAYEPGAECVAVVDPGHRRVLALRRGVSLPFRIDQAAPGTLCEAEPSAAVITDGPADPAQRQREAIVTKECGRAVCPLAYPHTRCCGEESWCDRYSKAEFWALRDAFVRGTGPGCEKWQPQQRR
jgi:hypothetical protein